MDFSHGFKIKIASLVKVLQFQICKYVYNLLSAVICEEGMFMTIIENT